LSPLNSAFNILLHIVHTHTHRVKLEAIFYFQKLCSPIP